MISTVLSRRSKGGRTSLWHYRITGPSTQNAFSLAIDGSGVSGGFVVWHFHGLRYRRPVTANVIQEKKNKKENHFKYLAITSDQKSWLGLRRKRCAVKKHFGIG